MALSKLVEGLLAVLFWAGLVVGIVFGTVNYLDDNRHEFGPTEVEGENYGPNLNNDEFPEPNDRVCEDLKTCTSE